MKYFTLLIFNSVFLKIGAFQHFETKEFMCRNNQTIALQNFCDGLNDCDDKTDEVYYDSRLDPTPGWQRCSNSDEPNVGPCLVHGDFTPGDRVSCDLCDQNHETHYRCQNGSCVPRSTICDGAGCVGCREDHGWRNGQGFKCRREGRECVLPQQLLHDDISDCDGEIDLCFGFKFPLNETSRGQKQSSDNLYRDRCFQCLNSSMIISTSQVCDDVIDCDDLSDECLCEGKPNPEICDSVVLLVQVGNEKKKASEAPTFSDDVVVVGSQMLPVTQTQCEIGSVECANGTCISRESICDGLLDCVDDEKYDYCRGTIRCRDSFRFEEVCRCEIGSGDNEFCDANYGRACDGVANCPLPRVKRGRIIDGFNSFPDDECYACRATNGFDCLPNRRKGVGGGLSGKVCRNYLERRVEVQEYQPRESTIDDEDHDGAEHSGDDGSDSNCSFSCDDAQEGHVSVNIGEICETSINPCTFYSAAEGCETGCKTVHGKEIYVKKKTICDNFPLVCHRLPSTGEMTCIGGRIFCGYYDTIYVKEIPSDKEGFRVLDISHINRQTVETQKFCNGIEDCEGGVDELNCDEKRFVCEPIQEGYVSIPLDQVCDGTIDCKDGSDETEERCNSTRFPCKSRGGQKVNIDRNLVCDRAIACDDGSDEKNCADGRFYCENGEPLFVKGRQKFDGRGDCSDWSDECPILNQTGATNGFSSRYEMIANPILRGLVWIMGILSICGNGAVVFVELRNLKRNKGLKPVAVANRLLILNLAVSDGLMGVYLIGLGSAGLSLQGHYCSQDLIWRSSGSCTTLGILSVLSSETSVMSMVFLTCCRLYSVVKPLASLYRPKRRFVFLMILSTWAISLTIALLPLVPLLSGIFATRVQLEYSPFIRSVPTHLNDGRKLFATLLTYDLKPNVTVPAGFSVDKLSWKQLESFSEEFFEHQHFDIKRTFGYYSTDSVCIPKFFLSRSYPGWGFSFFVNLINFCAFMFVASAHFAIYLHSKKNAKSRGSSVLQQKILRLIITDFCCWIPICVMAFSKLGGANLSNLAYVFAAIVLLPINSALNPLLYSSLPDLLYKKIASKFNRVNRGSTMVKTRRTTVGSVSSRHMAPRETTSI